jgi:uncharacterized protein (TIGR02145 family)
LNGTFFSQKLMLRPGSYQLTEFFLLDSSNNTILVAPLSGSSEANYIPKPLPISFEINKDVSNSVEVEVVSTENKSPGDFGLVNFPIIERNLLIFSIGVVDLASNILLPAKLTLLGYDVHMLQPIANNVVVAGGGWDTYLLKVEMKGYISYTHTYTKDSLSKCNGTGDHRPLLIELEKVDTGFVADIDGRVYKTVKLGNQWWMAEDLKTKKYNDGTSIPYENAHYNGLNLTTPVYTTCCSFYYNWYAVNTGKLSPIGWHVATNSDWEILVNHLGGKSVAARYLKTNTRPGDGDNSSGFSARANGGSWPLCELCGITGYWWTSSGESDQAWIWSMPWRSISVETYLYSKKVGLAIRCVKD